MAANDAKIFFGEYIRRFAETPARSKVSCFVNGGFLPTAVSKNTVLHRSDIPLEAGALTIPTNQME